MTYPTNSTRQKIRKMYKNKVEIRPIKIQFFHRSFRLNFYSLQNSRMNEFY